MRATSLTVHGAGLQQQHRPRYLRHRRWHLPGRQRLNDVPDECEYVFVESKITAGDPGDAGSFVEPSDSVSMATYGYRGSVTAR